ncbi:unnamed protein product [Scytosiphon promiscuus]
MTCAIATLSMLLSVAGATAAIADEPPIPPVWPERFHATMTQENHEDYGIVDLWYDFAAGYNLNIVQTQSGEAKGPLFDNERSNGSTYYYHPTSPEPKQCSVVDFGVGIIKPDWLKDATYLGEEQCGIYQCNKWEQGEIPQAHARFLGLRTADVEPPFPSPRRAAGAGEETRTKSRRNIVSGQVEEELVSAVAGEARGWEKDDTQLRYGRGVSLRGEDSGPARTEGGDRERLYGDRFLTYWSEKGTDRPVKVLFFNGAAFQVIRFDEGATMPDEAYQIPDYCFDDGAH